MNPQDAIALEEMAHPTKVPESPMADQTDEFSMPVRHTPHPSDDESVTTSTTTPSTPFELPKDLSLYQSPKRAFTSFRFILNLILGAILGWVINYVIALFTTKGSDRAALWQFIKDYNEEFPDGTSRYIFMYGSPIWADFLLSGLLTAFIGGFIGNFTVRWEVEHAKKAPILQEQVEKSIVYRAWGACIPHMALRSLAMSIWGIAIAFPIALILFSIICSLGGMNEMFVPPDFVEKSCYLTRGWFCLIKGFYCVCITTIIAPLIEVGALNTNNLTSKNLERYFKRKQSQQDQKDAQEAELVRKDANAMNSDDERDLA